MIGYGANRGLVPSVCEELCKAIQSQEKNKQYQVRLAQIVIYFQDLSRLYSEDFKFRLVKLETVDIWNKLLHRL